MRRILLVVYFKCLAGKMEEGKREEGDSLLRTIKTEFRTGSRFPVGISTRPTRISKSCRVVAELVRKASLSAETAEALSG